ncbi:hypothetical protein FFI89_003000 [Bradyrhizobium sp. KBS0727]|uniref:hypothetical protein n=1 Tax=unclassified Bradyrhizobium TaxID=2631580 RepID=UPI00110DFE61|nr:MULTISPECIES: hypothetical protein [unclassified Bradyrhizobium]QDW36198.1 hypothetical protein FFI71_003000 [Bradyrhizobium sp. KBS0725]QDW42799.1 hypothetical protein FFI89_003000 [Bradyrhizobium sp. KBS0727]
MGQLEEAADQAIEACGGDAREAVKALIVNQPRQRLSDCRKKLDCPDTMTPTFRGGSRLIEFSIWS